MNSQEEREYEIMRIALQNKDRFCSMSDLFDFAKREVDSTVSASQDLYAVSTSRVHNGEKIRSTRMLTQWLSVETYVKDCQRKSVDVLSIKHWRFIEDIPVPEVK